MRSFPFTRSAPAVLSSWPATTGGANAPGQFTILNSVVIPAGTYTVSWSVTLSGTTGANEVNNFLLVLPGLPGITSVNGSAAGTYAQAPVTFTTAGGTAFLQTGANNATAGSVYSETLNAGGGSGIAQLGPSFPRESWDVAVASVGAATNAAEAVCKVSQGAFAGQTFIGATTWGSTGDSTGNFSAPVYLGSYVFAVWTGGDPGAVATLTVTGTRRVP